MRHVLLACALAAFITACDKATPTNPRPKRPPPSQSAVEPQPSQQIIAEPRRALDALPSPVDRDEDPAVESPVSAGKEPRPATIPKEVVSAINDLNSDGDVDKTSALFALKEQGPSAAPAVPTLRRTLGDEDGFVREYSIDALGAIGPKAADAVPDLIRALWAVDELTRDKVIAALHRIDPSGKAASSGLLERLKIGDSFECEDVLEAFAKLGGKPKAAAPILLRRLRRSGDGLEKGEFISLLVGLGPAAVIALPELERIRKSEDLGASEAAAEAIKKIREARGGKADPMDW